MSGIPANLPQVWQDTVYTSKKHSITQKLELPKQSEILKKNDAIVKKLQCQVDALKPLREIKQLASEMKKKGDCSEESFVMLEKLKGKLPEEMQKFTSRLPSEWIDFATKHLQKSGIEGSKDMGGHGGTYLASVSIGKTNYPVFLKPIDETEARNYSIINKLAPDVAKFMSRFYGEVEIEGKRYLVLENIRKGKESTFEQLADIKLAGKVEGRKFNPIADQKEMQITRGETKNRFDFFQMGAGAKKATFGFMVASGPKCLRIFNYSKSKENVLNALQGVSSEKLCELKINIRKLQNALMKSPIALIGASIIFLKLGDGSVKPLLIDPAHMVVSSDKKEEILGLLPQEEQNKVYYGGEGDRYSLQKESNDNALIALIMVLVTKIVNLEFPKR